MVWKKESAYPSPSDTQSPLTNENDVSEAIETEEEGKHEAKSKPSAQRRTRAPYLLHSRVTDEQTSGTRIRAWMTPTSNRLRLSILDTLPRKPKRRNRSLDDDQQITKRHHNETNGIGVHIGIMPNPDLDMQDASPDSISEDSSCAPFSYLQPSPSTTERNIESPESSGSNSSEMELSTAMPLTFPSDALLPHDPSLHTAEFTIDRKLEADFHGCDNLPINQDHSRTPSPATESAFKIYSVIDKLSDPVFKPRHVQRLLARCSVELDLIYITQYLRKEAVFSRSKIPDRPKSNSVSEANRTRRIKAYADFLFSTSILDDAFPLYLLLWMMEGGNFGLDGVKLLVRCAQSAVQPHDQLLMECLLKQRLSIRDLRPPQQCLDGSLECLELVNILRNQEQTRACRLYQRQAVAWCPLPDSLLDIVDEAQKHIQPDLAPDLFTCNIIERAVKSASYHEELELEQSSSSADYELRDVLLVVTYLKDQDRCSVLSSLHHLRKCLDRAMGIFENPSWESRHMIWLERIGKTWRHKSRNAELAVLYELLVNWWTLPTESFGSSPELKQDFFGMSDIEVLAVISFLVTNGSEIRESFYPFFSTDEPGKGVAASDMRERILDLLKVQDDKLLMWFLWCFVKRNGRRGLEKHRNTGRYRDLISDMFVKSYNVDENLVETAESEEDSVISNGVDPKSLDHAQEGQDHFMTLESPEIDRPVEKQFLPGTPHASFSWEVYRAALPKQTIMQPRESAMSIISNNPTLAKSLSTSSSMSSMRRLSRLTSFTWRWSSHNNAIDEAAEVTERLSVSTISDIASSRPVSEIQRVSRGDEIYKQVPVPPIPEKHRQSGGTVDRPLSTRLKSRRKASNEAARIAEKSLISAPVMVISSTGF